MVVPKRSCPWGFDFISRRDLTLVSLLGAGVVTDLITIPQSFSAHTPNTYEYFLMEVFPSVSICMSEFTVAPLYHHSTYNFLESTFIDALLCPYILTAICSFFVK